ncbi:hypothetical protein BZZ01_04535 [Nostocales cyanobacterium HT-58-2]|nr:hypothetical protein BZZ01_04535 [Nostocales cyanobacterium HT-58-2]
MNHELAIYIPEKEEKPPILDEVLEAGYILCDSIVTCMDELSGASSSEDVQGSLVQLARYISNYHKRVAEALKRQS